MGARFRLPLIAQWSRNPARGEMRAGEIAWGGGSTGLVLVRVQRMLTAMCLRRWSPTPGEQELSAYARLMLDVLNGDAMPADARLTASRTSR